MGGTKKESAASNEVSPEKGAIIYGRYCPSYRNCLRHVRIIAIWVRVSDVVRAGGYLLNE